MDHSFENTARDKGYYQHEIVVCEGVGMGGEDFSCHFLSFLPCSCSGQERNSRQVAHERPTQRSARCRSPAARVPASDDAQSARCSHALALHQRGPNAPENSSSFILQRASARHTGSPSPDGLGALVFACSSCEPAVLPPKGTALLLPSRWLHHGLRLDEEAPLLPPYHVSSP